MKKSKSASSMVEAMVILMIVTTWALGIIQIMDWSYRMINTFNDKLTAVQLAKDALEGFANIRDTNRKSFPVDYKNCWNTDNYNIDCVWDDTGANDIRAWEYVIFQDPADLRRYLSKWSINDSDSDNDFKVYKDSSWFYVQTDPSKAPTETFEETYFTRKLIVSYVDENWEEILDTNSDYMKAKVIVDYRKWDLENELILTNWMVPHSEL